MPPNVTKHDQPTNPVIQDIKGRRDSITANTPAIFEVDTDEHASPYPQPWYAVRELEEVTANSAAIETSAYRHRLNPDLVRAIVWMESTHGWYDRLDPANKTIRPMNVHVERWKQLGASRKVLRDPARNIEVGALVLAALQDRISEPTPEKIATLYNQLGATKVSPYGKTVAYYMTHKPWLHKRAMEEHKRKNALLSNG
jgi:soluble lytic murein transglycosylase-like protein